MEEFERGIKIWNDATEASFTQQKNITMSRRAAAWLNGFWYPHCDEFFTTRREASNTITIDDVRDWIKTHMVPVPAKMIIESPADPAAFTFIITGDYKEEELHALVSRWLASIPAASSAESGWIDRNLRRKYFLFLGSQTVSAFKG